MAERQGSERWYIGRRHIEDDRHDPVVIDWRAPVAAPFYRATAVDAMDVTVRRRFTLDDGDITAYLDEHLDDPDGEGIGGIPDPVLAEIGAAREGAMREIVATIQAEQDIVIRSTLDQALIVQGGPGTGKTAVALHRAAFLLFEHRRRLNREGVLVIGPNAAFLDYIANVLPSLGERSVRQCTVLDLCVPKVEITAVDDVDGGAMEGRSGTARRTGCGRTRRGGAARRGRRRPPRDAQAPLHPRPGRRVAVDGDGRFAARSTSGASGSVPSPSARCAARPARTRRGRRRQCSRRR